MIRRYAGLALTLLACLFIASVTTAQDIGNPDTVAMVVSVAPQASPAQLQVQLDLYVYSDDVVKAATMGFGWDNPNIQMDSAKDSPVTQTGFDFGRFFFETGDIAVTNANQRFLFGGSRLFGPGVVGDASGRRLWASYYFTLSSWVNTDEINIDTLEFNTGSIFKLVNVNSAGYIPVWEGPLHIVDPDAPVGANLAVAPDSLSFTATEGGVNPSTQSVTVSSGGDPIGFRLSSGAGWLSAIPDTGTTDQVVDVSIDIAGLAAGSYLDSIAVSSDDGLNSPQQLIVSLTVDEPPPLIVVSPTALTYEATEGAFNPPVQQLEITNGGGSVLIPAFANSQAWLTVGPDTGAAPLFADVSVDITGLVAGSYHDTIVITGETATNSPVAVPVTLILSPPKVLVVTPATLSFSAVAGGANPDSQLFSVEEQDGVRITIMASESSSWMSLDHDIGFTPDSYAVLIDIAGLVPGTYVDSATITASEAGNSPQHVAVVLEVIEDVNTPPVLAPIADITIGECDRIELTITALDVDNDPLTIWVDSLVSNMQLFDSGNGTALFSFDPNLSQAGFYSLTAYSSDGRDTVSTSFTITVTDCVPTEALVLVEPNPMSVVLMQAIDPITAKTLLGNFTDGHIVADIDPASLLINGTIVPDSTDLLDSHPEFAGKVSRMYSLIDYYMMDLGPVYDTTFHPVIVTGRFADSVEFTVSGEIAVIGKLRGDFNLDGSVDIEDISLVVELLFQGGRAPSDPTVVDMDESGSIDVVDLMRLVERVFGSA
ncbi:MAG: dockerin type I domain-containing protein [Candidatus Zixiibacteriota bacterium]